MHFESPLNRRVEAQVRSKLANLCGAPRHMPEQLRFEAPQPKDGGPPDTLPRPRPVAALECQQFAQVGGCAGFCRGMIASHENVAGVSIAQCTANCLEKFHCKR